MPSFNLHNLSEFIESGKIYVCPHCYYCDKVSYESELRAKKEAAEYMGRGKGHSWAYECPKGKGWHLTSKKPNNSSVSERRKRNRKSGWAVFDQ